MRYAPPTSLHHHRWWRRKLRLLTSVDFWFGAALTLIALLGLVTSSGRSPTASPSASPASPADERQERRDDRLDGDAPAVPVEVVAGALDRQE